MEGGDNENVTNQRGIAGWDWCGISGWDWCGIAGWKTHAAVWRIHHNRNAGFPTCDCGAIMIL